eukprot:GHVR01079816.1.p1 GENE.GHVR01079816.1~~GHVR01079816.1.p1  ORF type:complete len:652 (+),score=58.15 GHVR01079816.1:113-2068(+)
MPSESTFNELHKKEILPMLDCIEKIRGDIGEYIDVPGILVAGSQSAGKSSLLESIGGFQLPRGDSITTRVPLIMSLECNENIDEPYAIIGPDAKFDLQKGAEKILCLEKIAEKISWFTQEYTGSNAGVKDTPIHLKVVRSSGPTMTVIDLPGITCNSSDQSIEDIEKDTKDLVEKYANNEQMIILCVVPATQDFCNCPAIKIAKVLDRKGQRTLGVVTKIDTIGSYSKIKEKIRGTGEFLSLELGFIAVRNRTQEEVIKNVPGSEIAQKEIDFFKNNSEVKGLENQYWGTNTLVEKIVKIQSEKVRDFFPKVKKLLRVKIEELKKEIENYPKALDTDESRTIMLNSSISKFENSFKDLKDGKIRDIEEEFRLSARLNDIFVEFENDLCSRIPNFLECAKYRKELETTIQESYGLTLTNFVSPYVLRNEIENAFHSPLDSCCKEVIDNSTDLVKKVLKMLLDKQELKLEDRFKTLMNEKMEEFLDMRQENCCKFIDTLIACEVENEPFTRNNYYMTTIQKVQDELKQDNENEKRKKEIFTTPDGTNDDSLNKFVRKNLGSNEGKSVLVMQVSLYAYSKVILKRSVDFICKGILNFLVKPINQEMNEFLIKNISTKELERALREDSTIANKRKCDSENLIRLENAMKEIRKLI